MRRSINQPSTDGAAVPGLLTMTWIPIAGLTFAAVSTVLIAIMVVLSLIPIYISNNFQANVKHLFQLNITYRSDLINGRAMTVDVTNELRNSLTKALNLYAIDDMTAQFVQSVVCVQSKSYSITENNQIKAENQDNTGDLLLFNLSAIYPRACHTNKCQQNYLKKVQTSISTTYSSFSLTIHFTNGVTSNVKLSFCSFNNYTTCQTTTATCLNQSNNTCDAEGDEDCCFDEDTDDEDDYEDEDEDDCSYDCDDDDDNSGNTC